MIRSVAITKRAMDIVISVIVLLVTAIPLLLLCIAISLESRGWPIYSQYRMKRHFRDSLNDINDIDQDNTFKIYKLRTMFQDAESTSGAVNAGKDDLRVTRIGKILRRTRLDELPNFINVLFGDMSVVGPRADRYEIQQNVKKNFPLIFDRTSDIRPGITGWAQLELMSNGEPIPNNDFFLDVVATSDYNKEVRSFRFKMYYDSAYAIALTNFWTFLKTDLCILARTPIVMFFRRNTI